MKKKTFLLGFGVASLAIGISAALICTNKTINRQYASSGDYTITINPNDITTSTTATSGQVTLKTDQLKNDVKFDFANVKNDGTKLIIEEDGYIANAPESLIRSISSWS